MAGRNKEKAMTAAATMTGIEKARASAASKAKAAPKPKAAELAKAKLVDATREIMKETGLRSLQVRDVVARSGVTTGSLYYHFGGLDGLAAAVNSATLDELDKLVSSVAPPDGTVSPREVLVGLGVAYHRFARQNTNLWAALFELGMSEWAKPTTPDHVQEHMRLMVPIVVALRRLFPDESVDDCRRHASMLLSAIHGIVIMSLERRMLGVEAGKVDDEIRFLLRAFCDGAPAGGA
jgi:AcrR family transcriptional regulator